MRRGVARQARGFTLLEMIVVLAILGFALGLILTHGPVRSAAVETRAAASAIAGNLRLARTRAMAEARPVSVAIDPATHRIQVEGQKPAALPVAVGFNYVNPAGKPVAGETVLRFAPDGSASGGAIELVDGNRRAEIGIDWLTGRVRITDAPLHRDLLR